jgi:hypothetical protein
MEQDSCKGDDCEFVQTVRYVVRAYWQQAVARDADMSVSLESLASRDDCWQDIPRESDLGRCLCHAFGNSA